MSGITRLLRHLIPLVLLILVVAVAATFSIERLTTRWFLRDLLVRGQLIARLLEPAVSRLIDEGNRVALRQRLERTTRDERLYALAICGEAEEVLVATELFRRVARCGTGLGEGGEVISTAGANFHVQQIDLENQTERLSLYVVHDLSFAKRRIAQAQAGTFLFFLILGAGTVALAIVVYRATFGQLASDLRTVIRSGKLSSHEYQTLPREFLPILRDMRTFVREIEGRYQGILSERDSWNADALRALIKSRLSGGKVVVLANREPYIHIRRSPGNEIEVQWPASGMVTALEPIMRACSGTWVAHGSGNADRETVDIHDRVRVPPDDPSYSLRRVWLTPEEEDGYYYGFSNEGLWPLCHIAHMRPIFRQKDWEQYKVVNEKFAEAVVAECDGDEPIILVQDYHFALAPRLIRQRKPHAIIITFWHVPWPNPEKFGICPWQREILQGLLGSTIIGFHTRYHVNHFLDTVDTALESRVDRELQTVTYGGDATLVRNYPISIEFPPQGLSQVPVVSECRRNVIARHQLPDDAIIGVGVERLDYTKGILERFWAIERFLERYPSYSGQFSFIQIASPSRSRIPSYNRFAEDVRELAAQINARYPEAKVKPIILIEQHHEPDAVQEYYRAAHFCMVTSLHDGMNLVAKEFVAARDDERGVLLLSIFAGASRELPEALIINPYDAEQCATAIERALQMSPREQEQRMRSMREQVRQANVFRWAGQLMLDAAQQRERARLYRRIEAA